jgi:hypothetical protein
VWRGIVKAVVVVWVGKKARQRWETDDELEKAGSVVCQSVMKD